MNHYLIAPKEAFDECVRNGVTAWHDVLKEAGKSWQVFVASDNDYDDVMSSIADMLGHACIDDDEYGTAELAILEYDWLYRPLFDGAEIETLTVEVCKSAKVKIGDGTYIVTSKNRDE